MEKVWNWIIGQNHYILWDYNEISSFALKQRMAQNFNVDAGFMIEQQNLNIAGDFDGQKQIQHKKQ